MIKAVFLDRDGSINSDKKGYISNPNDFTLFSFSAPAIKILNDNNYLVFLVTNQSGVGRGYFTTKEVEVIHKKLKSDLAIYGAKIDKIYYSTFHKTGFSSDIYNNPLDRKPLPGMFERAKRDFDFDIKSSFMIGDKSSDIKFGKNCGLKTILLLTGEGEKSFYEKKEKPDFVCKNVLVAAKLIKDFNNLVK